MKFSLVCYTQSYFGVSKNIRLNSRNYFVMRISNFSKIVFNDSSDIDFQELMNFCKSFTTKAYSFLVVDTTFVSDNSLRFRKNLFKRI